MLERLREFRKSKGLSCRQMADKLGLTKGTYSKKERGIINMSLADAYKIATILNTSVEEIFYDAFHKKS